MTRRKIFGLIAAAPCAELLPAAHPWELVPMPPFKPEWWAVATFVSDGKVASTCGYGASMMDAVEDMHRSGFMISQMEVAYRLLSDPESIHLRAQYCETREDYRDLFRDANKAARRIAAAKNCELPCWLGSV